MPVIKTGPRVVVSVTATGGGDWQVVSTPTGFQGVTSALFADNDYLHGFVRFENGVDWEEYDSDDDTTTNLLQVSNITGTVTIARPATPYASSNSGSRVTAGTGTHTLTISLGSGTMAKILRDSNRDWKTFTSADATPSVADYRFFKTAGSTTITAFDDMQDGTDFIVMRGDADISIADGAGIALPNDQTITLTAAQPLAFFAVDNGVAHLVARSGLPNTLTNAVAATELTISSGAITPTAASHTVDTEGDSASDDLDTITATNFKAGDILTLSAANGARSVVIKHGTGNISHPDGSDVTLDDAVKTSQLRYDGSGWNILATVSAQVPNTVDASELTIAAGAVTITSASHTIDTEADASADDLTDITMTGFKEGALSLLSLENASRTVTVKTTGNIATDTGTDIELTGINDILIARKDGATVRTSKISRDAPSATTAADVVNVTALKAIVTASGLANNARINLLGYASVGDGGGGVLVYSSSSTATSNDFTVFRPDDVASDASPGRFIRVAQPIYDLRQAGATLDGATDDGARIEAAIATGLPLTGGGLTAGVSFTANGTIEMTVNGGELYDVTLKQLTPAATGDVRTLTVTGNDIKLIRVEIDRNGDGTNGSLGNDSGIWITGDRPYFEDVTVFGNDMGSGVAFQSVDGANAVRLTVRDIAYDDAAATDDRVQGIWVNNCTNCYFDRPIVRDLSGNAAGEDARRYTRAFVTSGCDGIVVVAGYINSTDQGYDLTGTNGSKNMLFLGCVADSLNFYGFKAASAGRNIRYISCTAKNIGETCFIFAGPSEAGISADVKLRDVQCIGCIAENPGFGSASGSDFHSGFYVSPGAFDVDFPKGIKFIGCSAIDSQATATMRFGFLNTVTSHVAGDDFVECDAMCTVNVSDAVATRFAAAFSGIESPYCITQVNASGLSIPNNSWTSLVTDITVADSSNMHDGNDELHYIRRDGIYRVDVHVEFAADASATFRGARILLGGGVLPATQIKVPNNGSSTTTQVKTSVVRKINSGQNIRAEVFQDSGGALNATTNSTVTITRLSYVN